MTRIKTRKPKSSSQPEVALSQLIRAGSPSVKENNEDFTELARILLSQANSVGTKKEVPGRVYNGTISLMNYSDEEYLYLSNGYIARGVDTEAAAIMRNGIEIVPSNTGDQKALDLILQFNDMDLLSYDIARNVGIYGRQFMEVYDDKETGTVRFELLPSAEMDYLRDEKNYILYDKSTGKPQGYIQKRDGTTIATWKGEDAKRIIEFKYRTLGGCIEGISNIQSTVYSAVEYGYIRGSLADSFIRSLPVAHIIVSGATPLDIEEVTTAVSDKFTARTVYVTSERFAMENKAPANNIDAFKYIEPTLSEIAACFHMPIEMLASTEYLKGDDFIDRYAEWIEYIKVKQKIIASIFEHQVFSILFTDPVKVRFNSPVAINTSDLIKNVGFAVQSGAITTEAALDILSKNQVFGPYSPKIDEAKGTTGPKSSQNQTQDNANAGDQNADAQPTE